MYVGIKAFIALVWLINGLFCKVINLVPRHEQIVASLLGTSYSRQVTLLIGLAETVLALLIMMNFRPRLLAVLQMVIIAIMNIIEFVVVPELLMWGRFNALFALLLIIISFCNEFIVKKQNHSNEIS